MQGCFPEKIKVVSLKQHKKNFKIFKHFLYAYFTFEKFINFWNEQLCTTISFNYFVTSVHEILIYELNKSRKGGKKEKKCIETYRVEIFQVSTRFSTLTEKNGLYNLMSRFSDYRSAIQVIKSIISIIHESGSLIIMSPFASH